MTTRTETINIVIREDGSRVVTRNINEISKSSDNAGRSLGFLKSALAALAGGVVINQLKQFLDTFTTIQNKLKLTTTSQANLNAVFNELVEISGRTRSSLEDNAALYSKIAVSAKELGVSQREVLDFTESLNKAIKISGATAQEASAGIQQLSQGLASGRLQGDELRSVLENLPAVADVIAKSLHVTRGELRQLGADGKISAGQVIDAFKEARVELDTKFGKIAPTIAEGFIGLKNELIVTIGQIDKASGASGLLGGGLLSIQSALKTLTPELIGITRALTGTLDPMDELSQESKNVATALLTLVGIFKFVASIATTLLVTPFKLIGNLIGGLAAGLISITKGAFQALKAIAGTFTSVTRSIAEAAKGNFSKAGEILKTAFTEPFIEAGAELAQGGRILKETFSDAFDTTAKATADIGVKLVDQAIETTERIKQVWSNSAREIQDRQKDAVGGIGTDKGTKVISGPTDAELKKQQREREKLLNQLTSVLNQIAPLEGATLELAKAENVLTDAQKTGLITKEQELRFLELLTEHYRDILDPLGKLNRDIDEQTRLLGFNSREREVESALIEIQQRQLQSGIILTGQEIQGLRDKLKAQQDLNLATQASDKLLGESVEKRRQFSIEAQAMKDLLANPDSGFTKGDAASAINAQSGGLFENTDVMFKAQAQATADMYAQIDELRQKDLISEQAANAAKLKLTAETQETRLSLASGFFGNLTALASTQGKKQSGFAKAAAITEATINTYLGAQKAYTSLAGIPYVGPALGIAAAAAAIKLGFENIQHIRSGFMSGGYTGDIGSSQVAGAVHGQEYVFDRASTARIGVDRLNAIRSGKGGGGGGMNVNITNLGTSKQFEVRQLSDNDVQIIARDEAKRQVAEMTPYVVAGEIGNPNSRISKSLQRNTQSSRRR